MGRDFHNIDGAESPILRVRSASIHARWQELFHFGKFGKWKKTAASRQICSYIALEGGNIRLATA